MKLISLMASSLVTLFLLAPYTPADEPEAPLPQVCDDIGQPKTWSPTTIVKTGYIASNVSDALAELGGFSCEDCVEVEQECPMVASGGQAFGAGNIIGGPDGSGTYTWVFRMTAGGEVVIKCESC